MPQLALDRSVMPMETACHPEALRGMVNTDASGCSAPVLICGVAGKGAWFEDQDGEGFYGGGGSGVFWPSAEPIQRKLRGIYIVDTSACTVVTVRIPRAPLQRD